MSSRSLTTQTHHPRSLVARIAARYSIDADKMLGTLKQTAFRQPGSRDREAPDISNEQMMALLVLADRYKLDPFTKELYAFPDRQRGIVPIVGVDGWIRLMNEHPQANGLDWRYPDGPMIKIDADARECWPWIECVVYRKDRGHPTVVREYLEECYRARGTYKDGNPMPAGPWQSHTKRMLRHKALIQAGRVAFGFAGLYDPDEGARIIEGELAPEQMIRGEPGRVTAHARLAEALDVAPEGGEGREQRPEPSAPPRGAEEAGGGDPAEPAAPSVEELCARAKAAGSADDLAQLRADNHFRKGSKASNAVADAIAEAERRLGLQS